MIITIDGNIPSYHAHSFNVMKMAQGFVSLGEPCTVVSLLSYPNLKLRVKTGKIHKHYGVSKKVKVKLLPVYNRDVIHKSIGAKDFHKSFAKYIKKNNPDFIYCRSFLNTMEGVNAGIPTILETHTTHYQNRQLQQIYQIANKDSFLGLVTIHENIKSEHVKNGIPENKILVLEDGVDLDQFKINDDKNVWRKKLNLPLNKKIVMYCGSLFEDKGIDLILNTAEELANSQEIQFVICGGNPEQVKYWKDYAQRRSINNTVFTGFVSNQRVPEYLKAADALIMPYKFQGETKIMDINSTSPLKLFEYMASGRPIISSNIPVISKIVEHDRSAILVDEPGQIKTAILELINEPQKAKELANNAKKDVEKYSWQKRCKEIIDFFVIK